AKASVGPDEFISFCARLSKSPAIFLLARSHEKGYRTQFAATLARESQASGLDFGPNPFPEFVKRCKMHASNNRFPERLRSALAARSKKAQLRRRAHKSFVSKVGLSRTPNPERIKQLEETTPTIYLGKLKSAYPELFHWICENEEIMDGNEYFVKYERQADRRLSRRDMLLENPAKLAHVVRADENAIIRDSDTGKIVAFVLRDFCGDAEVLEGLNGTIAESVSMRVNIRKEDTGKLVLTGYSAGSRSHPTFDWMRNLQSKKTSAEAAASNDMAISSAFALFWNLMRARLPDELLESCDAYLAENGFCRMDGNRTMGAGSDGRGSYFVQKGGQVIEFQNEELAPPAGVMGVNYASRSIHWEHHPYPYGYSWTTGRNTDGGGNFYIASHGVKIEQAPDTFIAWMPRLPHGTSMLNCDPKQTGPPHAQLGLSIVGSMRLASTWQRYCEGQLTVGAAVREYAQDMEHGIYLHQTLSSELARDRAALLSDAPRVQNTSGTAQMTWIVL
ncbi:hypothetical protein EVJ58_g10279, partial [Rhodofomes roseus]